MKLVAIIASVLKEIVIFDKEGETGDTQQHTFLLIYLAERENLTRSPAVLGPHTHTHPSDVLCVTTIFL